MDSTSSSLRPLFLWMRVFGIDLDRQWKPTKFRRWWNMCFGLVMLLFMVGSRCHQLFEMYETLVQFSTDRTNNNSTTTNTQAWNRTISFLQATLTPIGIHLVFFIHSYNKWAAIWHSFRRMDDVIGLCQPFYCRLRKATVLALFWISTVCI